MHSVGTWWMWASFLVFVLIVLSVDTFFLGGKKAHHVSVKEASAWVVTWLMCALIFAALLLFISKEKALEFLTGYLIEESLSVDNMFVFIMIFGYFSVPAQYQRRVLLYGVLGAIVMRLSMILLGTWLVNALHWILYVFGAFLIFTGIKMLLVKEGQQGLANNKYVKWLSRHLRMTDEFHDEKFFIRKNKLWYATPLFLVLILIEVGDIVFALDSIPAIFAITTDPFIVFTSNIFAIMGLRALYFLLAHLAERFSLLKYGVALMLVFIGIKMLIADIFHIPILVALGVLVAILSTTIILNNLLIRKR